MGGKTLNERVVSWHLIEDVLGWVAVLVGTLVMMVFKIPQVDPLLSIAFSFFMIWNVAKQLFKTLRLFLQATPEDIDLKSLGNELLKLSGVKKVHDIHVWSLDGMTHVLTVHVVVAADLPIKDCVGLKRQIRERLGQLGSIHATIEVEWDDETCSLQGHACHQD
jgi:cobalt-zinc-cadmium efflux system protein